MRRIVVVGAGLAGHRAALELRRLGFAGELVMVGDEPYRPYDRPPLSKKLLLGTMTVADCAFRSEEADIRWMLGRRATGLDPHERRLRLDGDEHLAYDGLVIATGRRARPWRGLPELDGFHTLRSLDDAVSLRAALKHVERVAIVGAGFIGCEVAATLRQRGVPHVALIDVAPHPMPALGPEAGARAARMHAEHGVTLHLSSSVARFEGRGRVDAVVLGDGRRVEAQLVLVAVGSTANTEWLQGSGLDLVDGDVVCDQYGFATPRGDIVAAGDVAAWRYSEAGATARIEHWTNARDMGERVAANLLAPAGEARPYRPVPTFWSDQYDVKIKSVGFIGRADRHVVVDATDAGPTLVEAYRGDELVGAIGFDRGRTMLDYQRRLVASAAPPGSVVAV